MPYILVLNFIIWQRLIDFILFNTVFNTFSFILWQSVHLSMLSLSSLIITPHNVLAKPLAAFPHSHCRNNSSERGMNSVTVTIISPRKEYWRSRGSNQRPPVFMSAMLPTELWGSALFGKELTLYMTNEV